MTKSATFYTDLYSRGKTSTLAIAAYGLGLHGKGYRVLTSDLDIKNDDDRLIDYLTSRNIDRGYDFKPMSELPDINLDDYDVVLLDGGRDPDADIADIINSMTQYVVIPVETQKDIRNVRPTLKSLNGQSKGFLINRLKGNVTTVMNEAAKAHGVKIVAKVNELSPEAHAIITDGNAPHLMPVNDNAARDFKLAAESLANELAIWMELS